MNRICLLLLFLSGNASGQSFTATVTDVQSGLPVPDVYVKVLNSHLATVTDEEGTFRFSALPPMITLVFSAVGYETTEIVVSDSTLAIALQKSSVYLRNDVTITARRFETSRNDISEGVTIVDSRELQETSSRSAPEALIGTTGIWVQKTNHGSGSPVIRGLMGNQVLLMVDGIRMNNATYRYGPNQYLSTIDPGLIERIEAIRGNGSILYGSDALGGVVQVLSRTPHFEPEENEVHGMISGKWMSREMEKSLRSELQFNGERIAALAGFSRRKYGDIVAGGSFGTLEPTGYDEFAGDGKVLIRTGTTGVLTAAWQHHQQNAVPRYDQVVQGGYSLYDFDPQVRQLGYLRWETFTDNPLINTIKITGGVNRSVEGIVSQKGGSVELKEQKDIVNTFNGVAEVHSRLSPSWEAQSGIEWYYDVVSSKAKVLNTADQEETTVRGSYADGATSSSMAIFSSHSYNTRNVNISAGARFNAVALSVDDAIFGDQKIRPRALVANLGFAYSIHPPYRLFINANTGFRAPNVDDVSKFGAVESTVFEIPSAKLSPERSRSIEAGIKVAGKVFSGSLAAYRTALTDLIDRVAVTYQGMDTIENRRVYQKQNVSESVLQGIEAEGSVALTRQVTVHGNLTYTYGKNVSKDEPMRRIPPLFGKLGIRYQHDKGFWLSADYIAAGAQRRLAPGDLSDARISVRLKNGVVPSWNIFNLHSGFSYKFLSLIVSGQNLLDEGYRVYASGVDGYGRNVSITVRTKF